jgi:hypothetical protein
LIGARPAFENRISIGERGMIALGEAMIFRTKSTPVSRKESASK